MFVVKRLLIAFLQSSITVVVKKEGWGGGGARTLSFTCSGQSDFPLLTPSSKTLKVVIGEGLSKESRTFVMKLSVQTFSFSLLVSILSASLMFICIPFVTTISIEFYLLL